jgi:hypothetical protein
VFSRAVFRVEGVKGSKKPTSCGLRKTGRGINNIIQEDSRVEARKRADPPRKEEKEDEQLNVALYQFGEGIRSCNNGWGRRGVKKAAGEMGEKKKKEGK